jgi:hypothetical protein
MPPSDESPPALATETDPEVTPDASLAWSRSATVLFAGLLIGLLAVGLWSWLAPVAHPHGLPDDPDVARAREMMVDGLPRVVLPEFVLVTSLAGETRWMPPDSVPVGRLAACRERIVRASDRHPGDVRLDATVAHLELAGQRLDDAMLHYRQALERSPHYGEARLGLGIAMVTLSLRDADPDLARKRALEALGQFANVDRVDPVYLAALYDRVLLLTYVGRTREAARLLDREPAIPNTGLWAARFRRLRAGL